MQPARIAGTVLLSFTIVFGLVLMFVPLGTAWVDTDTARTTETYSMFSKERETTATGVEATGDGTTYTYFSSTFDERGGATFLRLMGPILAVGLFLCLTGLLLNAIPRTSDSIAGGFLALPGALMVVTTVVFAVLGSSMAAADFLPGAPQVDWNGAATTVAVLMIFTSLIGAGMGLVPARPTQVDEHIYTPAGASGWVAGRNLRCPQCSTVVTAGYGVVPICPGCGFGSDYDGPASPPVPVTPVGQ